MKPNEPRADRSKPRDSNSPSHIPGRVVALIFVMLAVALVLGYLLVNKLADISRNEDCILAHRKNCAAIEPPSGISLA
jgi:hypothetical protein